jgi:hypothetical protein
MTLVSALQAFPHAFRSTVMLAETPGTKSGLFASWGRLFQQFASPVRARILAVRSALVIWKDTALVLRGLCPKIDLLLIVGRPGSSRPGCTPVSAPQPTAGKYRGCEQVIVLDDRLLAEQISKDVREALADFLCERYAAYKHLLFPGWASAEQR